ncbi:MAG: hypothetical protein ABIM20_05615 [candidate division WOR-3 bacterium]
MAKVKERITLEEARKIVEDIEAVLKQRGIRFGVYGSYIRREETIGDLDILVHEKDCEVIRSLLKNRPYYGRLEIYCIPAEKEYAWETFAMYLTGSGVFNIWIRSIARNKGFLLNQYGLFERNSGELISVKEEEIFDLLSLNYIPPEIRSERYKAMWRNYFKNST